jgi:diacylglycerol kinase (ATP)
MLQFIPTFIFVKQSDNKNMQTEKDLTIASRSKSFGAAFSGLREMAKEPNAILHAIATVMVVVAGILRHLDAGRWVYLVVAIGIVWITEILNTSVERLSDYACDNKYHPTIKVIKDLGAAAVLVAAIISSIIGIIVFFF